MAVLGRPASRLALALALALGGCTHTLAPETSSDGTVRLRHRAPPGSEVWVVGDWNDWEPGKDPMASGGGPLYEAVIHLPPGTYTYAYAQRLPDAGLQIVPPEAAQAYVEDDLGGKSGLIRIEERP